MRRTKLDEEKIDLVEPRIVKNVKTTLVYNCWSMSFGRGETSGLDQDRRICHLLTEPSSDQRRRRSDLIREIRHYFSEI